jgi:lipopolysaccharide/colanic/teichoic acid biosynthesis glycosyltransferase
MIDCQRRGSSSDSREYRQARFRSRTRTLERVRSTPIGMGASMRAESLERLYSRSTAPSRCALSAAGLGPRRAGDTGVRRLVERPPPRPRVREAPPAAQRLFGDSLQGGQRMPWVWEIWAKRAIDLLASTIGLVVVCPAHLAIAAAIKLEDRGPIFFNATRVGRGGRPFRMYKYRTMVVDAEARLADLQHLNRGGVMMVRISDDPRVTRVGRILRPTHLDELPQFLNVLRGDMSLVGPRPQYPREVANYTAVHRRRLDVRPGITGLCQIVAPHSSDFEEWVCHDLAYIDRWSLWLDLRILALTAMLVLGELHRTAFRRLSQAALKVDRGQIRALEKVHTAERAGRHQQGVDGAGLAAVADSEAAGGG